MNKILLKAIQRIDFYIKKLTKTVKKCKTFEERKFIRSLKQEKGEDKQILLQQKIKIIKDLDSAFITGVALVMAIRKKDKGEELLRETKSLSKYLDVAVEPFAAKFLGSNAMQKDIQAHMLDLDRVLRGEKKVSAALLKTMDDSDEDMVVDDDIEWESDASEDFGDGNDVVEKKKNRRGQQARRAIWERKFGEKAQHMLKEKEMKVVKAKEKALGIRPPVKKVVDTSLHPSWQAKKSTSVGILQGEGTKIVFGQDGEDPAAIIPLASLKVDKQLPKIKKPIEKVVDTALHPSWLAKKNTSAAIVKGEGKKIVFGQDGEAPAELSVSTKKDAGRRNAEDTSLHLPLPVKNDIRAAIIQGEGNKIISGHDLTKDGNLPRQKSKKVRIS